MLLRLPRRTRKDEPTELDPRILGQAQEGEEEACRALYRHYSPRVFAFLVRMTAANRTAEAEDLMQETFARVFRALPRFKPDERASLSTWILTIAYRLTLNAIRRRKFKFVQISEAELAAPGCADEELHQKLIEQVLVNTVLQLPPDFRAVFLLSDYHDLTYDQIASVVGTRVGTVKSRLFRARREVRKALEAATNA